jgi:hypothetical protein
MLIGTKWRPFTAVEEYEVGRIGFAWRARFALAPLTWLDVVDEYCGGAGAGRLEGRLWGGLRVMRSTGHDTDVGQALRYLSELVWNPYGIICNRDLEWTALTDGSVEVATVVGSSRVVAILHFGEDGNVTAATMPVKPRIVKKETVGTPWLGEVRDYTTLEGVRMPRELRGLWNLPEGPSAYWEGRITQFEMVP